jgi:glycosyltransferase involved in cell wall biosynthesis
MMVVRLFDPWMGGMEKQSLSLARALDRRGHDVRILTGRWFRGTPRLQSYDGIDVIRHGALFDGLGIRGMRRVAAMFYMATLAVALFRHRDSYDVIHVHGLSYHAYVAVRLGKWLGRPVIVKLANSGSASDISKMKTGQHLFFSRYLLPMALMADRFVALNDTISRELEEVGVDHERIVEIPNGVEVPAHPLSRPNANAGHVISYLGRLHEQKAVDLLIRAFALLRKTHGGDVRLRIIGDGPARSSLEALVDDLGLGDSIGFLGEVKDIDVPLGETRVLVLPSVAEGMSNVLLEAMARGIPVVASDIPPNTVLVNSGDNGWLFPSSDPAALADVLSSVLGDGNLLGAVGLRARQTVEERFDIDRVAERYSNLYAELCGAAQ